MLKKYKKGGLFEKNAKLCLIYLYNLTNKKRPNKWKNRCIVTTKYLARQLGKRERQVYYYLQYLRENHYIYSIAERPIHVKPGKCKQKREIFTTCSKPKEYKEVIDIYFAKMLSPQAKKKLIKARIKKFSDIKVDLVSNIDRMLVDSKPILQVSPVQITNQIIATPPPVAPIQSINTALNSNIHFYSDTYTYGQRSSNSANQTYIANLMSNTDIDELRRQCAIYDEEERLEREQKAKKAAEAEEARFEEIRRSFRAVS